MERRLTEPQEALVRALDAFFDAEDAVGVLFVVWRPKQGKNYAVTEWITRCSPQLCQCIALYTLGAIEAQELLDEVRTKLPERAVVRRDLRGLLHLQDTPLIYASVVGRDRGREARRLFMPPLFALLQDDDVLRRTVSGAARSVWFITDEEIERAQRLCPGAKCVLW